MPYTMCVNFIYNFVTQLIVNCFDGWILGRLRSSPPPTPLFQFLSISGSPLIAFHFTRSPKEIDLRECEIIKGLGWGGQGSPGHGPGRQQQVRRGDPVSPTTLHGPLEPTAPCITPCALIPRRHHKAITASNQYSGCGRPGWAPPGSTLHPATSRAAASTQELQRSDAHQLPY